MWIIGCDFHPRYQQIAAWNQATGEFVERRLSHEGREAAIFYESLPPGALIGMEATAQHSGSSACWNAVGTRCG